MTDIRVLDCTLRDGGYYNNWDFLPDLVENYLTAISGAGVHTVELGLRLPTQEKSLGPFAYCTDDYLKRLPVPENLEIAVMVNAKDLVSGPGTSADAVDQMFQPAKKSPVSLVRIASHVREISDCREGVLKLKELGYRIGFNIMQVAIHAPAVLGEAAREISGWGAVDVLYFADSLGNMDAHNVSDTFSAFREGWPGDIGIHAHNNMGQALINSMAAIDAGATWIDGTILGMGRGAGNVCMEYLLVELARNGHDSYYPEALFDLVMKDFSTLKSSHNWGPNLFYYLSAVYGIHPTYVQVMIADGRYDSQEIISALKNLRDSGGVSFSNEQLSSAFEGTGIHSPGTWSVANWARGRTVLVVGHGPGVEHHLEGLCEFIDREKPAVICLNAKSEIPPEKVDAYITCSKERLAVELELYRAQGRPLVAPRAMLSPFLQKKTGGIEILDYGINVEEGGFSFGKTECAIPVYLPAPYALAFANAAGAERILLAGFDGFPDDDPRQAVMANVIELYRRQADAAPVIAITPSRYPLKQSLLDAPD